MSDGIESIGDENAAQEQQKQDQQAIFAAIFSKLMDGFGKACEEEGVTTCFAIAKHPSISQPLVFWQGEHIVDAASLMAGVLREIKADILSSLSID